MNGMLLKYEETDTLILLEDINTREFFVVRTDGSAWATFHGALNSGHLLDNSFEYEKLSYDERTWLYRWRDKVEIIREG